MPRLLSLFGLTSALLLASSAQAEEIVPKFTLSLPKTVTPGSLVKAKVKVVIPEGWHAYQNPPSQDYQIPLTLEAADKTLKNFKAVYPKGVEANAAGEKSFVYGGTIEVQISFTAPAKPGSHAIKLKAGWQVCNEGSCLPPSSSTVSGALKVAKAPVKPKSPKAKP